MQVTEVQEPAKPIVTDTSDEDPSPIVEFPPSVKPSPEVETPTSVEQPHVVELPASVEQLPVAEAQQFVDDSSVAETRGSIDQSPAATASVDKSGSMPQASVDKSPRAMLRASVDQAGGAELKALGDEFPEIEQPMVYEDPFEVSLMYMEKHNILQIFQVNFPFPSPPYRYLLGALSLKLSCKLNIKSTVSPGTLSIPCLVPPQEKTMGMRRVITSSG